MMTTLMYILHWMVQNYIFYTITIQQVEQLLGSQELNNTDLRSTFIQYLLSDIFNRPKNRSAFHRVTANHFNR